MKEGDYVKQGQILYILKNVELEIQHAQYQNNLNSALANVELYKAKVTEDEQFAKLFCETLNKDFPDNRANILIPTNSECSEFATFSSLKGKTLVTANYKMGTDILDSFEDFSVLEDFVTITVEDKYKIVPVPSLLVAQIFPPWSSMIFFTMDKPIPLPPVAEFLEEQVPGHRADARAGQGGRLRGRGAPVRQAHLRAVRACAHRHPPGGGPPLHRVRLLRHRGSCTELDRRRGVGAGGVPWRRHDLRGHRRANVRRAKEIHRQGRRESSSPAERKDS